MDSKFRGQNALFLSGLVFFLSLVLPFSSANATGSIGRQVASFCSPAMTSPDVGSCQACHMTTNESKDDLNAAGRQSLGNPGFFCPASGGGTGTGTGGSTGAMSGAGGGSGMSGTSGRRSGMGRGTGSRRSHSHDDHRRSRGRDDDDDDDDDRRGGRDDDDD